MEPLREWLLAVLAVSLLVTVAQAVMPEGAVKGVGRLICGLLLFLAVARPVLGIQYNTLSALLWDAAEQLAQEQAALEETGSRLTEEIIVRETDAYIEDKSAELGIDCQTEVVWDSTGTVPVPAGVNVTGTLTASQRQTFTQALTEALGLEESAVHYHISNEEAP